MTGHHPTRCRLAWIAAVAVLGFGACNSIAGMDGLVFDLTGTTTTGVGGTGVGAQGGGQTGGGGATGGGLVFTDDELEGEFGEGSFAGTAWNGDHVGLAAGNLTGAFQSRVFDAGSAVAWSTLAWSPGGPYGKPLPDDGAAEADYRSGGVDMSDNVLLWHFEGTVGALVDGAALADSSGSGYGAVVSDQASLVAGVFGLAVEDDMSGYVYTPMVAGGDLHFGTSDFTWSLWVNSTLDCPPINPPSGNRVYMGADESGGDATHLWFGCTSSVSNCPDADGTGRAGGTFCSRKTPTNDCQGFCGRSVVNDGEWHNMVIVKQGHAPGTLSLYVDGEADFSGSQSIAVNFDTDIVFPDDNEFTIGAFTEGTFQASGTFEEVAVWRRALAADEAAALYSRGALQLSFQVRVCEQADCSDEPPFVGPSGEQSAYVDPADGLAPPTAIELSGLAPGRYFQYRAAFETLRVDLEPALFVVTVRAFE